jgi:hypothetical protein
VSLGNGGFIETLLKRGKKEKKEKVGSKVQKQSYGTVLEAAQPPFFRQNSKIGKIGKKIISTFTIKKKLK